LQNSAYPAIKEWGINMLNINSPMINRYLKNQNPSFNIFEHSFFKHEFSIINRWKTNKHKLSRNTAVAPKHANLHNKNIYDPPDYFGHYIIISNAAEEFNKELSIVIVRITAKSKSI
jgi:hypothetical protein